MRDCWAAVAVVADTAVVAEDTRQRKKKSAT
jgi:hypothetical protein